MKKKKPNTITKRSSPTRKSSFATPSSKCPKSSSQRRDSITGAGSTRGGHGGLRSREVLSLYINSSQKAPSHLLQSMKSASRRSYNVGCTELSIQPALKSSISSPHDSTSIAATSNMNSTSIIQQASIRKENTVVASISTNPWAVHPLE